MIPSGASWTDPKYLTVQPEGERRFQGGSVLALEYRVVKPVVGAPATMQPRCPQQATAIRALHLNRLDPWHHGTKFLPDLLDGVIAVLFALLLEPREAILIVLAEGAGELA